MSNCIILQKVVYRLPGTKRPVSGVILYQNEDGISVLFIAKPNGIPSHSVVLAVDAGRGHYEDAKTSRFNLDKSSLAALGARMQAIAEGLDRKDNELERMLEDLF